MHLIHAARAGYFITAAIVGSVAMLAGLIAYDVWVLTVADDL